ncbi:MAG: hypothetical protein ACRENL_06765 [Candidatus Dormibacteria bacterium]
MAARKRRRPAAARRVAPAAARSGASEPAPAPAAPRPARTLRAPAADAESRWNATGLLVLLAMVFVVQIPVGAILNLTSHTNPLIIDIFFFQPQYLVVAAVLVMPLARRLAGQPRKLRLLESLSLGIMYSLLALMLGTVFVHPATASVSTDQFVKHLKLTDGLLLAFGDVLALFGTVALYPSFSRMLGAPGRRARARMLNRTGSSGGPARPSQRRSGSDAKPRR